MNYTIQFYFFIRLQHYKIYFVEKKNLLKMVPKWHDKNAKSHLLKWYIIPGKTTRSHSHKTHTQIKNKILTQFSKRNSSILPMIQNYTTIDIGIVSIRFTCSINSMMNNETTVRRFLLFYFFFQDYSSKSVLIYF